jgi:hypothetical protein
MVMAEAVIEVGRHSMSSLGGADAEEAGSGFV